MALRGARLLAGPGLALVCYLALPAEFVGADGAVRPFEHAGRVTLGLMVWMATWWLTEAVPVPATALLPLAVLPVTGASSMREAAEPFGSPLVFLFLGGFILAQGMQRWGLDRRVALLALRLVGGKPANMIGGFMAATALLSAGVSNTATTAMMLPIALSLVRLLESRGEGAAGGFRVSLFLGIAYAASIGGLATLIGSPPNVYFAQYAETHLGFRVTFARWLLMGLPVTAVMLPVAWWLLTRVLYAVPREEVTGSRELIREQLRELGAMRRGERVVMLVFLGTVLLWITRPLLLGVLPGLSDPGIAIMAALVLFAIPVGGGEFAMDWDTAARLPWGVLVLFGGGLSLAAAVSAHGVDQFIGGQVHALAGLPAPALTLGVTTGVVFLTELTSNLATVATLVPLLVAMAPALGVGPLPLMLPATLAASCAFMLPVATPPNAIVFGSGCLTIRDMCRAGLWLNLIAVAVITAHMYAVVLPLLG